MVWKAADERLGIGTSSPISALDVRGESVFGSGTDGVKLTYSAGNSTGIIDTGFTSTGLEFRTGNSFAAKIDSSGNVGIGVVPSAWGTTFTMLDIGSGGASVGSSGGSDARILANAYFDTGGSWRYSLSNYASYYRQISGTHQWGYAASGSADAAISWSEAMRLDSSGTLITKGAAVFNEDGADKDFRVESDDYSSMFAIDAGNNQVGFGRTPLTGGTGNTVNEGVIQIADNLGSVPLFINAGADYAGMKLKRDSTNNAGGVDGWNWTIRPSYNSGVAEGGDISYLKLNTGYLGQHEIVFNEDSYDLDFRVESNSNSHMLFVDAGNGRVGIRESSPEAYLHISGMAASSASAGAIFEGSWPWLKFLDTETNQDTYSIYNDDALFFSRLSYAQRNDAPRSGTSGGTAVNHLELRDTENIFNNEGQNIDFRVESDAYSTMFTVDAGNNWVGIGQAVPASGFDGDLIVMGSSASTATAPVRINRTTDGYLIRFMESNNTEGYISVSGTTVSYNGFAGRHESSGIPTTTARGTVVSTIDELDVYLAGPKQGQARTDHAKVEVSNTVGDPCVYGVVDDYTETGAVNVVSVGIGAVLVTGSCAKGDLLESNGDGTAKVQSDDIIRSKTIGKVTIGNSDTGVKLVPCVMYCG
jgi:hypothetical protein